MKSTQFTLETSSKVLIRCFWMGFAILSLWGLMFLVSGDWKYGIPEQWFGVTPHEFDVINYSGIIVMKGFVFGAFLLPYLAIRMVLSKESASLTEDAPE